MHEDSVSNHINISEDDKPSLSPSKQQTLEVAPYTPPPEGRHGERHFNIKLVGIPIISGSQGNKKSNIYHLSNRGKGVRIVHTIGLNVTLSHKLCFQSSNSINRINLNCKNPTASNGFLPNGIQSIHLLYHGTTPTKVR